MSPATSSSLMVASTVACESLKITLNLYTINLYQIGMFRRPSSAAWECVSTIQKLFTKSVKRGVMLLVKVIRLLTYFMFVMKNCFLLCVIGLTIACIICCRVNVTLDMTLGVEDILISWFVIILALLGVASLFVCCMRAYCSLRHSSKLPEESDA